MDIRLIDAGKVSGIRSQTIYHGLGHLFQQSTQDTIVIAQPTDPYFSIGYFQDAQLELDVAFCKEKQIPIIRRQTGGGAVFLDHNQVFVQWIFHPKSLPASVEQKYRLFIEPMVATYKHFGIEAYYHPVNDIHVNQKKIAGLGAAQIGNAQVITGNFLLDFDFRTMLDALNIQQDSFRLKAERDMKKYMTTIKSEVGTIPNTQRIVQQYTAQCAATLNRPLVPHDFTPKQVAYFEKLDRKMTKDAWLYKHTKKGSNHKMLKINAGVWIGSIFQKMQTVEFQLKFGNIDSIEIIALNRKPNKIAAFDGTPLTEELLMQKVHSVFSRQNTLAQKSKSYWENTLLQICQLRKKYA